MQLPRRTILAAGPAAFAGQSLRAVPRGPCGRGGGGPHAYSLARGTAGPGPRLRTALPATVPARGSDFESTPQGCRVAQGAPQTLAARPSVEGLWGSLAVPPHRHKLTSKACVHIFSRNSPEQESPLTHRLTHPYPFSWFYLPPQFSAFCARG